MFLFSAFTGLTLSLGPSLLLLAFGECSPLNRERIYMLWVMKVYFTSSPSLGDLLAVMGAWEGDKNCRIPPKRFVPSQTLPGEVVLLEVQ